MNSSRPYLIRAIYDWIVDNGLTPYLLVDASAKGVQVPSSYISNGKIVLNISPGAVQGLQMQNSDIHFDARFSGKPMSVSVPITAAMAIYAKENGRGMAFADGDDLPPGDPSGSDGKSYRSSQRLGDKSGKAQRPNLRVVK